VPIPIDTTTIDESQERERRKDLLMKESYILSNRLSQLRYDMRHSNDSKQYKFEEQAIENQLKKIAQEIEEIKRMSDNKKK
jgi:hypothetical protein